MNIKYIEGDEDLPGGYYCKVGNVFYLIEDLINNKDKEIERLNKELDKTRLSELNKEYIINELEKWLVESIEKHTEDYLDWKYDKNVYLAGSEKLQNVFDKLQELKGADK